MRVLVVLAHPDPCSFNAQMATLARETLVAAGHEVETSDLYAMDFDPREGPKHYLERARSDVFDVQFEQRNAARGGSVPWDVRQELDKLMRADLLILQYPTWWFSVPAIMKGWIDRVLLYGTTYTSQQRYDRGLLAGKQAMLSVTFGGPESTFAHNGRNGDVELLLWPMHMSLYYVGYEVLQPFTAFGIAPASSEDGRREVEDHLHHTRQRFLSRLVTIQDSARLKFNRWGDWDGSGQLKPGVAGFSKFMRASP